MTSTSSFSTLGCILSGTWNLCMSEWLKWYQTLFFYHTLFTFPFTTDAHTFHFAFLFFFFVLVISVPADLWLSWLCSYTCRQCLCTSASPYVLLTFLCLSSGRSSVFTHAGLLPCLIAFLHTGKDRSSALRRLSLKISQLSCTPLTPRGSFPWDAAKEVPEEAKACFSEVQDYNSAVSLAHFP